MNRLGIFCFYNKEGIVDSYTEYLLYNINKYLSNLIIVINGDIKDASYDLLNKYAYMIIQRQNIGFDGGAYQDVILNYVNVDMLENIDEILLFNSSFWGPIQSFDVLFGVMDKKDVDFWGMTKWIEGPSSMPGYSILPEHVQAYFLGIRASLFKTQLFREFWTHMKLPLSYDEAIRNFEISFTTFFANNGFKYTTFIEEHKGQEYLKQGEVVYIAHGGDLVTYCDFPIIKKKIIDFMVFDQIVKIDNFLCNNQLFNKLICSEISKMEKKSIPYNHFQEFYEKYDRIFIYGHGKWGKSVESYFNYKGWSIEAFIVSQNANLNNKEVNLLDADLSDNDGVIIALGKDNIRQVCIGLFNKIDNKNVLLPKYVEI